METIVINIHHLAVALAPAFKFCIMLLAVTFAAGFIAFVKGDQK